MDKLMAQYVTEMNVLSYDDYQNECRLKDHYWRIAMFEEGHHVFKINCSRDSMASIESILLACKHFLKGCATKKFIRRLKDFSTTKGV